MDSNANLSEQRAIVTRLLANNTNGAVDVFDALRLAELVQALDEWIRKGGFLPVTWQRNA